MSEIGLKALYPFLEPRGHDASSLEAALIEAVREKSSESRVVSARFFDGQAPALVAAARAMASMWQQGGTLFAMGNGGSSCDASHITVEFLHPITAGRPALAAVDLGCDTAMVSAVGNDVGFGQVFVRQLIARARAGDGLVGFSTSGNSENLLAAYAFARDHGIATFGLAGGDGGRMRSSGLVDHCLVVETTSIHRVQECHVAAYHILWDLVHTILADVRGSAGEARHALRR